MFPHSHHYVWVLFLNSRAVPTDERTERGLALDLVLRLLLFFFQTAIVVLKLYIWLCFAIVIPDSDNHIISHQRCRALWEICPVGSRPWSTGTWRGHTCRKSLLKVRVCRSAEVVATSADWRFRMMPGVYSAFHSCHLTRLISLTSRGMHGQ